MASVWLRAIMVRTLIPQCPWLASHVCKQERYNRGDDALVPGTLAGRAVRATRYDALIFICKADAARTPAAIV